MLVNVRVLRVNASMPLLLKGTMLFYWQSVFFSFLRDRKFLMRLEQDFLNFIQQPAWVYWIYFVYHPISAVGMCLVYQACILKTGDHVLLFLSIILSFMWILKNWLGCPQMNEIIDSHYQSAYNCDNVHEKNDVLLIGWKWVHSHV